MNWGRTPPNWRCRWKCVNRRAAGSDRQFRTRSSEVLACQGMRNVVQGPPGCYECVAIISSQELTVTRRSNRRYDIVNNTSLLRWIPVCSHFGNKTLRSSSIPQFCFDALRQNQLEKGNKEKRRKPGVVIEIDVNIQLIVKSIAFSLHPPKHRCCSSSTLDRQFVA